METRVLVRVQAKGGTCIGPDGGCELVVNSVQAAEGNMGSASHFFAETGSGDAC